MQKASKPVDRRTNSGGELLLATAEAFAAAAEGDPEAAAKTWLSAAEMIAACNPTEPVRAMILNNAGVAHLMRGDRSSARAALHESRRSWNTAKAILADIDVPLRPGSSAFHFRLAIEHHESFSAACRLQFERQRAAADVIAVINTRLAMETSGEPRATEGERDQLAEAFGPRCLELACVAPDAAQDFRHRLREKASSRLRARRTHTGEAADWCEDLEQAASHCALMHPSLRISRIEPQ